MQILISIQASKLWCCNVVNRVTASLVCIKN